MPSKQPNKPTSELDEILFDLEWQSTFEKMTKPDRIKFKQRVLAWHHQHLEAYKKGYIDGQLAIPHQFAVKEIDKGDWVQTYTFCTRCGMTPKQLNNPTPLKEEEA